MAAFLLATVAVAQSDRGTITGTVTDPVNAVVPGAKIVLTNIETGALYETVSTGTGNFTLASLPVGTYSLNAEADGFAKLNHPNIRVGVAQVLRIDLALKLGSSAEAITVTAEAPLLRTENAEQSINLPGDRINALPLNFGGGNRGSGAIRSPFAFATLLPGTSGMSSDSADVISYGARINGLPGDTYKVMVEGQDATSGNDAGWTIYMTQASVEMIGEFSLQTSNFAAEFGQVGGGLFNFTTRSGTNRLHGSAYEYLINEAFDAHHPYTAERQKNRKHDFGFSLGGPVIIPKAYDGRNKTFFFANYEAYKIHVDTRGRLNTVPTEAMRRGDFSAILTGRNLGADGLGRAIPENTIYDPASDQTIDGKVYRLPFPGNIISPARIDPVAAKIQGLFPAPINSNLVNNWEQNMPASRDQWIFSAKIDHNFSAASKSAFYYSKVSLNADQDRSLDGLPVPITGAKQILDYSHTARVNFDHTFSPNLLLHTGAGVMRYREDAGPAEAVRNYDAPGLLGFVGSALSPAMFPSIGGLNSAFGGMLSIGSSGTANYYDNKYTGVASVSYVRGNHTYKTGGEYALLGYTDRSTGGANGALSFSAAQTGLPATQGMSLGGGSVGFRYASFLLGRANSAIVQNPADPQYRRYSAGLYIQDTWKVTRKLTVDYGLRWDYQPFGNEIHYRSSQFGPSVPNPAAGGLSGGLMFEGYGPGRCNCQFTKTYRYAIGPRLGVAYQITPKTVVRGGWGIVYSRVRDFAYGTKNMLGVGQNQLNWSAPGFGETAVILQNGLQYDRGALTVESLDPGLRPQPGQLNWPGVYYDQNIGRPGRINQWNLSLQRTVTPNLMVEAAYLGNRGVWLVSDTWNGGGALERLNVTDGQRTLAAHGLDITNPNDRELLTSRIDSGLAASRGFFAPYAGFPGSASVAQALRPYPQFSSSITPTGAPLGNNWYDSLQVKVTKRYSHNFELTGAFTWQKELEMGTGGGATNNIFNRGLAKSLVSNSQPLSLVIAYSYETPRFGANRILRALTGNWTLGGIVKYTSGTPIATPASNNELSSLIFQSTTMDRVPGQPLFLQDLNCRSCFDPNKDFVLNPAAWTDPPPGQWGAGAIYYNDYRTANHKSEQMSFGRTFRVGEGMHLMFRAEFFNIFNRVYLPSPESYNPFASPTRDEQGVPTSGFGRIDPTRAFGQRNGQIVARFQF